MNQSSEQDTPLHADIVRGSVLSTHVDHGWDAHPCGLCGWIASAVQTAAATGARQNEITIFSRAI